MEFIIVILHVIAVHFTAAQVSTGGTIKFLFAGQAEQYPNPIITSSVLNVDRNYRNANRVCVTGKWIFYTFPNFGIGLENEDNVIEAAAVPKGLTETEHFSRQCLTSLEIGMPIKEIRSLRLISGVTPTTNSLTIFSEPQYLGTVRTIQQTSIINGDGIRLGSLIFAKNSGTTVWELCASEDCLTGDIICLDSQYLHQGTSIPYTQESDIDEVVQNLDTGGNIKWPRLIRAARVLPNSSKCNPYAQHIGSPENRVLYLSKRM